MAEGGGDVVKILHIVPGVGDVANGMVVVARLIAKEQSDAKVLDLALVNDEEILAADEVWVHGMWLPKEWAVCRMALKAGKRLVRMTHGSLSPVYLKHQSPFMKWLVGPIERRLLRRSSKIVVTCEAEAGWVRLYLGNKCPEVEVTDLKRFFKLRVGESGNQSKALHVLYLGRRHPLKGVEYLEQAVNELVNGGVGERSSEVELKIVNDAVEDEKERAWEWCDVLVLPTLSENFGLVVAEALERGKRVITTDGAPVWGEKRVSGGVGEKQLVYLKGYRDGTREERVRLLKAAIGALKARAAGVNP